MAKTGAPLSTFDYLEEILALELAPNLTAGQRLARRVQAAIDRTDGEEVGTLGEQLRQVLSDVTP